MKKLSFFNKIIFLINNIIALLFLASLVIPYIPPERFPMLSVLSLAMPLLILLNVGFLVYWILIGFKRQFFLSGIMIFLAVFLQIFPYKFKESGNSDAKGLKIMTFNVRLFNRYHWIDKPDIAKQIGRFILKEQPDIVCLQEYYNDSTFKLDYPYRYLIPDGEKHATGLAVFSRYPFLAKGSLNFENSNNNAIYADVLTGKDTLRIYNIHLESTGINPNKSYLDENVSKRLLKRIADAFVKQQRQVEKIVESETTSKHRTLICGDFNNTAYSWAYRILKDKKNDTFLAAGTGFGETYNFRGYPLRIDFILTDPDIKILKHQNYRVKYSDHFPVMVTLEP